MARRSVVQQGTESEAASPYDLSGEWETPRRTRTRGGRKGRVKHHWGGGGGRWLVWVGRVLLWAFIIVVLFNGIRAPFERATQATGGSPAADTAESKFPKDAASAFAAQFAMVYLNYDESQLEERADALKEFIPPDAEANFGWDGTGKLSAHGINVAGVEIRDEQNATVLLSVRTLERRMRLSVPVYASQGGFVVTDPPALLPEPRAARLPPNTDVSGDSAVEEELRPELETFFEAYAKGDAVVLRRYGLEGEAPGLAGAELSELADVIVPEGTETRQVTATVVWSYPDSGKLHQTYQLEMEKQGSDWFVKKIRGAGRVVE